MFVKIQFFLFFYFLVFFGYSHEKKFFLGVTVGNISKEIKEKYYLSNSLGAIVLKLNENGPAIKGGLSIGDIILSINEKKINNFYDVIKYVSTYSGNGILKIIFLRENILNEVTVELVEIN